MGVMKNSNKFNEASWFGQIKQAATLQWMDNTRSLHRELQHSTLSQSLGFEWFLKVNEIVSKMKVCYCGLHHSWAIKPSQGSAIPRLWKILKKGPDPNVMSISLHRRCLSSTFSFTQISLCRRYSTKTDHSAHLVYPGTYSPHNLLPPSVQHRNMHFSLQNVHHKHDTINLISSSCN